MTYTATSAAPVWIVILRNIAVAALAGALFGSFLFPLYNAVLQAVRRENFASLDAEILFEKMITAPLLIFFILPFFLPLVVIAGVVGVLFQKSIQNHLKLWCFIAPVSVWLMVIFVVTRKPLNYFHEHFTGFERFLIGMPNAGNFIFLMAAAFSSFVFYKMSKNGFKW